MVKVLVVEEDEPEITVTLTEVKPGTPGKARGWYGSCTDCGPDWTLHRWKEDRALTDAHHHIDVTHGEQS